MEPGRGFGRARESGVGKGNDSSIAHSRFYKTVIPAKAGIQGFIATQPQPLVRISDNGVLYSAAPLSDRHSRERGLRVTSAKPNIQ
ncbi:hypothetical protein [Lysobacter capsici]|uniref:hypothetical protein n=1 Tax=Lysobacter capsici TaxID=435897 RepID=UPI0011DF8C34|nr:hypothetical protein [Lysobacter capsici]WND78443.1 hypothetical protein RJ610_14115 [Lysobacter capsici]WND83638.1 hypothetical protein RJ609_14125 [Lysobacter capsici]